MTGQVGNICFPRRSKNAGFLLCRKKFAFLVCLCYNLVGISAPPLIPYCYYGGLQFGALAQLARAPALQAGGQEFESLMLHQDCSIRRFGRFFVGEL